MVSVYGEVEGSDGGCEGAIRSCCAKVGSLLNPFYVGYRFARAWTEMFVVL